MIIQDSSPHGNCQEGTVAAPGTVPLPDIDAPRTQRCTPCPGAGTWTWL